MREPYKEWAEGHINKIKSILDSSRAEHTEAVKERIRSVEQMKDVVEVTKGLFAVSKVRPFFVAQPPKVLIPAKSCIGDCPARGRCFRATPKGPARF